jgi:hypothetical protein
MVLNKMPLKSRQLLKKRKKFQMLTKKTHWKPPNLQMKISAIIKYKILNKAITKSL